jgi:hypothetical protein
MIKLPEFPKRAVPALVERDAEALIASCRPCAYDEARTCARDARLGRVLDGNRPVGHWDKVRREIARLTGRQVGMDTATRYIIRNPRP